MSAASTGSKILIQNMMHRAPLHLAGSDTVQMAMRTMVDNHVSALPVIDEDKCLIGIVALSDLMAIAGESEFVEVGDVMTEAPVTANLGHPLMEAAGLMMEHQLHHLPVVNSNKQLVGVVSSIDFVRLAADGRLIPSG